MPEKSKLSWESMRAKLGKLKNRVLSTKHKSLKTNLEQLSKATDEAVDSLNKEGKAKEAETLSKEAEKIEKDPSKINEFIKKLKNLKITVKIKKELMGFALRVEGAFSGLKDAFLNHLDSVKKKREKHKKESVEKTRELYKNILDLVNNSDTLFFGKDQNGDPAVNAYSIIKKILNDALNNNSDFAKLALENKKSSIYLFYKHLVRGLESVSKEIDKRFNSVKNSEGISEKLVKIQLYGMKMFLTALDLEKFLKKHLLKTSSLWAAVNDQEFKNAYAGIRKKCEQLSADYGRIYVNMFPSKNTQVDMNDSMQEELY